MNNLESKLCEVCQKPGEYVILRKYVWREQGVPEVQKEPHYACKEHTTQIINSLCYNAISFHIRHIEDELK